MILTFISMVVVPHERLTKGQPPSRSAKQTADKFAGRRVA